VRRNRSNNKASTAREVRRVPRHKAERAKSRIGRGFTAMLP
jgi:ribosomal protein L13E